MEFDSYPAVHRPHRTLAPNSATTTATFAVHGNGNGFSATAKETSTSTATGGVVARPAVAVSVAEWTLTSPSPSPEVAKRPSRSARRAPLPGRSPGQRVDCTSRVDPRSLRHHASSRTHFGNVSTIRVPLASVLSTRIVPPCKSAMRRVTASPRPVPVAFRVT